MQLSLLNFQENLNQKTFSIQFDPQFLMFIDASSNPVYFKDNIPPSIQKKSNIIHINTISTLVFNDFMNIATAYFKAKKVGRTEVLLLHKNSDHSVYDIVIENPQSTDRYLDFNRIKEKETNQ